MADTAAVRVRIFGGNRLLLTDASDLFIRILDGRQREHMARTFNAADLTFTDLPFEDSDDDNYTVMASKPGFVSAGFSPVKLLAPPLVETVDLMLIPAPCQFDFTQCRFANLRLREPKVCAILSGIEPRGGKLFDALLTNNPAGDFRKGRLAADLLNLMTAMNDIHLRAGTPLDYLKGVIWDDQDDHGLQPDRFYAWADPELVEQAKAGQAQGQFDQEMNPKFFHPGATSSYKENRFGEANVQLTFHENDRREVGGVNCILVEPDIDYFRDLGAHGLLEVLPGFFPAGLTDPRMVYVLRWMASRRMSGVAEFTPPYGLVAADD